MSLAFYQKLYATKHDNVVPLDILCTISPLYPFNFELPAMTSAQEASGGHMYTHCQGGLGGGGWRVGVCRWGVRGRLSRVGT